MRTRLQQTGRSTAIGLVAWLAVGVGYVMAGAPGHSTFGSVLSSLGPSVADAASIFGGRDVIEGLTGTGTATDTPGTPLASAIPGSEDGQQMGSTPAFATLDSPGLVGGLSSSPSATTPSGSSDPAGVGPGAPDDSPDPTDPAHESDSSTWLIGGSGDLGGLGLDLELPELGIGGSDGTLLDPGELDLSGLLGVLDLENGLPLDLQDGLALDLSLDVLGNTVGLNEAGVNLDAGIVTLDSEDGLGLDLDLQHLTDEVETIEGTVDSVLDTALSGLANEGGGPADLVELPAVLDEVVNLPEVIEEVAELPEVIEEVVEVPEVIEEIVEVPEVIEEIVEVPEVIEEVVEVPEVIEDVLDLPGLLGLW